MKGPYHGHKKLMYVLEFEAGKFSNSLNQGKCSDILTNFKL